MSPCSFRLLVSRLLFYDSRKKKYARTKGKKVTLKLACTEKPVKRKDEIGSGRIMDREDCEAQKWAPIMCHFGK
jgi:hypothetical protein